MPGARQEHREPDDVAHHVVGAEDSVDPVLEGQVPVPEAARQRPQSDPGPHPHPVAELMHPESEGIDQRLPREDEEHHDQEVHGEGMEPYAAVIDGLLEDPEAEGLVDDVREEREEDDPSQVGAAVERVTADGGGSHVAKDQHGSESQREAAPAELELDEPLFDADDESAFDEVPHEHTPVADDRHRLSRENGSALENELWKL